jgi:hypothetical protein
VTDKNGRFSFEQLRPGKWTVRFLSDNLPPHHYFEKEELRVDLKPGEEKNIEAKVLLRRRQIQMVDEGPLNPRR